MAQSRVSLFGVLFIFAFPCVLHVSEGFSHSAAEKLKVYISADMEGVNNVVGSAQLGPSGFEYETFRRLMTEEVNAAARAAFDRGAVEVVVGDSHGNAQNLLVDVLDSRVQIVRGWPRPLGMMEGIDSTFAAAFFVGYHASSGSESAVAGHTFSGGDIYELRVNGMAVSESVFNAAIAGEYDVPVVFMSGDQTAIAETTSFLGPIQTAEVKNAIGQSAAKSLSPLTANETIYNNALKALNNLKNYKPFKFQSPVKLQITFTNAGKAEIVSYLAGAERLDGNTVSFVCADVFAASRLLMFLYSYK